MHSIDTSSSRWRTGILLAALLLGAMLRSDGVPLRPPERAGGRIEVSARVLDASAAVKLEKEAESLRTGIASYLRKLPNGRGNAERTGVFTGEREVGDGTVRVDVVPASADDTITLQLEWTSN
jgi:hypothetical protein